MIFATQNYHKGAMKLLYKTGVSILSHKTSSKDAFLSQVTSERLYVIKYIHKTMKRITKKAWFGKKTLSWGIRPVSVEGWLVTIVFLITVFFNFTYNHKTATGYIILAVLIVIFFIIARLTGDAPGSEAWDKLKKNK